MANKKILIDIKVTDAQASANINKTTKAVDGLAKSTKVLEGRTSKNKATSGLNNTILQESGRLASDAAYGFQGMANNLGQLVSLFQIASKNSGGFVAALKDLKSSFFGVGGILIGVQLLISFLPKIQKWFQKSAKAAMAFSGAFDKLSEKVGDSAGNFEVYIRTLESSTKSDKEKKDAIVNLKDEFPDFIKSLDKAGVSFEDIKLKTDSATASIEQYRTQLVRLAESQAATDKIIELSAEKIQISQKRDEKAREAGFSTFEEYQKAYEAQEKSRAEGSSALSATTNSTLALGAEGLNDQLSKFNNQRLLEIEEEINALLRFTDIQIKQQKKQKKNREEKKAYDALEVGNFNKQIQLIKEAGKIREHFATAEIKLINDSNLNSQEALENERQGILGRIKGLEDLGLAEADSAAARRAVNLFYNKLIIDDQRRLEEQAHEMRMSMLSSYADSLGSIAKLIGESTELGKIAALAEITANTAIGFAQGLVLAQKQALEGGPGASLAFPLFYATQIAAVLASAVRAKGVLQGGGASGGDSGTSAGGTVNAPDFNVVGTSETSQLAQAVGRGNQNSVVKAYVVGSEITSQQEFDRKITNTAGL